MDKKLLIFVLVVVAAVLLAPFVVSRQSPSSNEGAAQSATPTPGGSNPRPETISAELRKWLYEPFTHIAINPPQDAHAYFRYQNEHGLPGQRGIRVDLDDDVRGTLGGDWKNTAWKTILDAFCAQNNCTWQVVGPSTVQISAKMPKSG